jgi:TonB family protein
MNKPFRRYQLLYLKGQYVIFDLLADITNANQYIVRKKIYLGAAIIAISVTINSCSSAGNRKNAGDDRKDKFSGTRTSCYETVATVQVVDTIKKEKVQKKQKKQFYAPHISEGTEISCYSPVSIMDDSIYHKKDEDTLLEAEIMPQFPGGNDSLQNFIHRNLQYPKDALEFGISGKVIIQFIVSYQGEILNPRILKTPNLSCEKEAIRIIKLMPHWVPGKQNGEVKSIYFILPINFILPE